MIAQGGTAISQLTGLRYVLPCLALAVLIGVTVCAIGGVLAVCGVMDHYIDFLYLISSVFAPMATVLLVDRYLIRRGRVLWNLIAWLSGVLVYQIADSSPIGPSLTAIAATALLTGLQGLRR